MTHVLIIEDSTQLAYSVGHQLTTWHGFATTCISDPLRLDERLRRESYDVVLVDLQFEHLNHEFNSRRRAGLVGPTSSTLLISGLTAITTVREAAPATKTVVWTLGEANRRLHLLYAYEELGQTVLCSKSSGGEHADALAEAVEAALAGVTYVDPVLNSYLPAANAPRITATLLPDAFQRSVWRAVALGADSRAGIAAITGYAPRYIGNHISEMYENLRALDPGLPESHNPLAEIIRYAASNWQFFLDDAVRAAYP